MNVAVPVSPRVSAVGSDIVNSAYITLWSQPQLEVEHGTSFPVMTSTWWLRG
jgi:hypothetical protein